MVDKPSDMLHSQATPQPGPSTYSNNDRNDVDDLVGSSNQHAQNSSGRLSHDFNHESRTLEQDSEGSVAVPASTLDQRSAVYFHHDEHETLSRQFTVRPSKFFKVGRVFSTLWTEPSPSSSQNTHGSGHSKTLFGEWTFTKIRRFVVVREAAQHSTCVPIMTYQGRGVAKAGVIKADHAFIYDGIRPPIVTIEERPSRDEEPMQPIPIRVLLDDPENGLDGMSRLNLGKVYTVEHTVKVSPLGVVHPTSMQPLIDQFKHVFLRGLIGSNPSAIEKTDEHSFRSDIASHSHEVSAAMDRLNISLGPIEEQSTAPVSSTSSSSRKRHSCDFCGYRSIYSKDIRRHMETHARSGRHFCGSCGRSFPRIEQLDRHLRACNARKRSLDTRPTPDVFATNILTSSGNGQLYSDAWQARQSTDETEQRASQELTPGSLLREPTAEDWEHWRPIIKDLRNNTTIDVIRKKMADEGLSVTSKMLRDRYRRWGVYEEEYRQRMEAGSGDSHNVAQDHESLSAGLDIDHALNQEWESYRTEVLGPRLWNDARWHDAPWNHGLVNHTGGALLDMSKNYGSEPWLSIDPGETSLGGIKKGLQEDVDMEDRNG